MVRNILLLLMIALSAVACAPKVNLNDRMSFEAEKEFRQMNLQNQFLIQLDEASRNLVVSEHASSMLGSALPVTFNVGHLIDSYIQQSMYYTNASGKQVNLTIESIDFKFTFSAAATFAMQNDFDYCEMDIVFRDINQANVTYNIHAMTDIPAKEMTIAAVKGKAITDTVKKVVQELIIQVKRKNT